jgi:hypothetical protein
MIPILWGRLARVSAWRRNEGKRVVFESTWEVAGEVQTELMATLTWGSVSWKGVSVHYPMYLPNSQQGWVCPLGTVGNV